MNLIIHPVFHNSLKPIGKQNQWNWLRELSVVQNQNTKSLDDKMIKVYFLIALIEKYKMYVLSDRWNQNVDSCVLAWVVGTSYFYEQFGLNKINVK
jgi:hypothetical protein